jgi:hypothetical protein
LVTPKKRKNTSEDLRCFLGSGIMINQIICTTLLNKAPTPLPNTKTKTRTKIATNIMSIAYSTNPWPLSASCTIINSSHLLPLPHCPTSIILIIKLFSLYKIVRFSGQALSQNYQKPEMLKNMRKPGGFRMFFNISGLILGNFLVRYPAA